MCTRFYVRVPASAGVCVCSLGLFSVVSLIMRKLFNVCLPVERRGEGSVKLLLQRGRGSEIWGREPDRHSCSCSIISLIMTPTFRSLAPVPAPTLEHWLAGLVCARVCACARARPQQYSCRWRRKKWLGCFTQEDNMEEGEGGVEEACEIRGRWVDEGRLGGKRGKRQWMTEAEDWW